MSEIKYKLKIAAQIIKDCDELLGGADYHSSSIDSPEVADAKNRLATERMKNIKQHPNPRYHMNTGTGSEPAEPMVKFSTVAPTELEKDWEPVWANTEQPEPEPAQGMAEDFMKLVPRLMRVRGSYINPECSLAFESGLAYAAHLIRDILDSYILNTNQRRETK